MNCLNYKSTHRLKVLANTETEESKLLKRKSNPQLMMVETVWPFGAGERERESE